jgi:hypothetical protein
MASTGEPHAVSMVVINDGNVESVVILYNPHKGVGGMTQVVERLPSKHKAPSSNQSTAKE